jgi:hypothetical protein
MVYICHLRLYAWWLVKVMQRVGGKRVREKESKIKNQRIDVQVDRRSNSEPVDREWQAKIERQREKKGKERKVE